MSDFAKGMLVVLMLIYIVSPVDLAPGPVDDLIIALAGCSAMRKKVAEP